MSRVALLSLTVAFASVVVGCGGGSPDDGGVDDGGSCEPGATDERACGMCGTQRRYCDPDGVWQSEVCSDEGVCRPGDTMVEACGNCGEGQRVCDATCTWGPPGACVGGDGCAPGEAARTADGCPDGQSREVVCNDACEFEQVYGCEDDACTTPGSTASVPCGARCGERDRTCTASRVWEYGTCSARGECTPGTIGLAECGNCGMAAATCNDACTFVPDSGAECASQGECEAGAAVLTSRGCPGDAARMAMCDATCMLDASGSCDPLFAGPSIVLPFGMAPSPESVSLRTVALVPEVDVYLMPNFTASIAGEISVLRISVAPRHDENECSRSGTPCATDADCSSGEICFGEEGECMESPSIAGCVASFWTGAGGFVDQYENFRSLQSDPAQTVAALGRPTFGGSEYLYEALIGLADPTATTPAPVGCTTAAGSVGCPAYRGTAHRFVVTVMDEDSTFSTTSAADVLAALATADITHVAMWSGSPASVERASVGAVVSTVDGAPQIYNAIDSAVGAALDTTLDFLVDRLPVRVTARVEDDPSDAIDATGLVERIEVDRSSAGCAAEASEDTDADGFDDAFVAARNGSPLCFSLVVGRNDSISSTASPQVIPMDVVFEGDGVDIGRVSVALIVPSAP